MTDPEDRILSLWHPTTEGIIITAYSLRHTTESGHGCLIMTSGDKKPSGDNLIDYALVLAAIKRTLGFDYLIDTIEALYGEEPQAMCELTQELAVYCKGSGSHAARAIDSYQVRMALSEKPSRVERVLAGWHDMALSVLEEEFKERGWVE